jgi:hypothetical protein
MTRRSRDDDARHPDDVAHHPENHPRARGMAEGPTLPLPHAGRNPRSALRTNPPPERTVARRGHPLHDVHRPARRCRGRIVDPGRARNPHPQISRNPHPNMGPPSRKPSGSSGPVPLPPAPTPPPKWLGLPRLSSGPNRSIRGLNANERRPSIARMTFHHT